MIGATLGNYRIVSTIGEGGMGVVFRAEHVLIGRHAAVKLLQARMSTDAEQVERFFNEARAAAMIRHPGLCEVFDFGHTADGNAYIVMELLEGESLTARIARDRKLPIATALAIARQVANAVHAAHEVGIVHRDLKPENIYLLADPDSPGQLRTKVLDFGIAKLARPEDQRSVKTRTGTVFGTPRYMSPEQARNATGVDRRTDIYALGCILYEMLVGVAPFDYDSWAELVAAHMHEAPRSARERDPALPAELDAIVMRALAKSVGERFATMSELVVALETYARGSGAELALAQAATPPAGLAVVPQVAGAPTLPVTGELRLPPAPRRRAPWLVGGIAVTIAAAVTAIVLVLPSGDDAAPVMTQVPAVAPAPAPVPTPAPAPAPPVVEDPPPPAPAAKVRLVVESVPAGADVYRALDGVRLGKTPLARDYDRIDGEVELVLKLRGHRDARVAMSTAADGRRTVRLTRAPGPTKRQAPNPRTGPTVLDPYGEP